MNLVISMLWFLLILGPGLESDCMEIKLNGECSKGEYSKENKKKRPVKVKTK